jgi:hypothetical protein
MTYNNQIVEEHCEKISSNFLQKLQSYKLKNFEQIFSNTPLLMAKTSQDFEE